jgi:phosphoribosylformimino-5-aminoimidazole carboxamide ribonucleotide (ProFAR) isomerase
VVVEEDVLPCLDLSKREMLRMESGKRREEREKKIRESYMV